MKKKATRPKSWKHNSYTHIYTHTQSSPSLSKKCEIIDLPEDKLWAKHPFIPHASYISDEKHGRGAETPCSLCTCWWSEDGQYLVPSLNLSIDIFYYFLISKCGAMMMLCKLLPFSSCTFGFFGIIACCRLENWHPSFFHTRVISSYTIPQSKRTVSFTYVVLGLLYICFYVVISMGPLSSAPPFVFAFLLITRKNYVIPPLLSSSPTHSQSSSDPLTPLCPLHGSVCKLCSIIQRDKRTRLMVL